MFHILIWRMRISQNLDFIFAIAQSRSQSLRSPWPAVGKRELWEQPFQACAIDADCAVKPDRQNHQNSVISKWLLPELSFSDRWSRGTKTLGTRLAGDCPFQISFLPLFFPFSGPFFSRYLLCFIFFLAAVKVLIMGKAWKWDPVQF